MHSIYLSSYPSLNIYLIGLKAAFNCHGISSASLRERRKNQDKIHSTFEAVFSIAQPRVSALREI